MVSKLRLPRFIGNGMVLQRGIKINIWGWATAQAQVEVCFKGKRYSTQVDNGGKWSLQLDEAEAGGPYDMLITSCQDKIAIEDILIGDVWLCSGQSNMDLPVARIKDFSPEVVGAKNNDIRSFKVDSRFSFYDTYEDYDTGTWRSVSPDTIMDFSATAYFFAEGLYNQYHVPIGLLCCSLGGSPVEAWISEEGLKEFPQYLETLKTFQDERYVEKILKDNEKNERTWYEQLSLLDKGIKDKDHPYYAYAYDDSNWATLKVPGYFDKQGFEDFSGVLWLRKEVEVPASMVGKPAKLWLGTIVDSDDAYVNGECVGSTAYRYPPRKYEVRQGLLQEGKNVIALRIVCNDGCGEMTPDKCYALFNEQEVVNLEGDWKVTIGAVINKKSPTNWVTWKPTALYNGMLSAVIGYGIKGAIWYQGESNTDYPKQYEALFKTMIVNWRKKWKQGDFPFLYVQLPNFMRASDSPVQSNWAQLRQAQLNTLSLPNTGMIVAIDVGEWNDLHPVNKKAIGSRLALLAREKVYGEAIYGSSPMVASYKIEGCKVILTYNTIGSGLIAKDGETLNHFAIVGTEGHYVWAKAKLQDNKVIVWNDDVPKPTAVRYAWADNPASANLYTNEGLPAVPFELYI